ncbi:MAG: sigma-70 family RNA polymerase sigma factor [Magnetococcus sp. WYHC-3]
MKLSNESTQDSRWAELAFKAQKGDRAAYNTLLREIVPFIRSVLSGRLANPDWAEDIIQEVLISVHRSLKTYSHGRAFKPWLAAIIQFRRTDFLRRHYSMRGDKRVSLESPEFQATYVTGTAHAGEYKDIEAALDTLPPEQRKVFELFRIKGYSAKEVAKQTGMSVTAVKVSAHRAGKVLKKILQ